MGSMFRSEEMALCQIFFQTEAAYNCVSELGELSLVQFRDLNPDVNAFQRKYVNEVRRCDELEKSLKFIDKELKEAKVPCSEINLALEAPQPKDVVDLEATIARLETELKEINVNATALKRSFLELTELKHILRKTQYLFDESEHIPTDMDSSEKSLVSKAEGQTAPLSFVAGVIAKERLLSFERMVWRVSRGNAFLKQMDIEVPLEDPVTGMQVHKTVFLILYQGDQLKQKVKKICDGFRASVYPCPESTTDRRDMATGVMTRIEDLSLVLKQTEDHKERVLVAAGKNVGYWMVRIRKMKAIYHIMNYFNYDVTQKCLIAECWCSIRDLESVQEALNRGTKLTDSDVPSIINRTATTETPPTYHRLNKFTRGFQAIVDAYGVAGYREVNPAPFTIITFPFLFAVMFGDFGHGILMASFALWMVLKEKSLGAIKSDNEIWNTFFHGRYIILLMGTFSLYTGLIYNDVFSKSFNIFGSSWQAPANFTGSQSDIIVMKVPETYYSHPYPFGLDPVWQLSTNKILFTNSVKMKVSITLGVAQMLFGICLSIFNHLHFRNYLNVFCEFIPQLLFMLSIFGYLVVLIFFKWIYYDSSMSGCAPTLLVQLINMFMFSIPEAPCNVASMYEGQSLVQYVLVIIAVLCIPWMLLIKPFILQSRHKKANQHQRLINTNSTSSVDLIENGPPSPAPVVKDSHGHEDGEFNFGDIFIHQVIHTIEYCLGSISHTASYLRLWALSLAHAQLSEVLWTMVMQRAFMVTEYWGCVIVYLIFGIWAGLTIGILLIMEGLSAFLHALRLHWVEFQSKFYAGNGYSFSPYSFKVILEEAANAE